MITVEGALASTRAFFYIALTSHLSGHVLLVVYFLPRWSRLYPNYLTSNFRVCQRLPASTGYPKPRSHQNPPSEFFRVYPKNARKARLTPSPTWLALPHPDHRPCKSQWKTISEVPVVIFHSNNLHMHLHDLFLRFIRPPVWLSHHNSCHYVFLHLLGLYPPPKISTWTSTYRTKTSFKNAI